MSRQKSSPSRHDSQVPSPAQVRFERLFSNPGPELNVALAANGVHPFMYGLPEYTLDEDAYSSLLDDTFGWLAPPPRTVAKSAPGPCDDDTCEFDGDILQVCQKLALAILQHPQVPRETFCSDRIAQSNSAPQHAQQREPERANATTKPTTPHTEEHLDQIGSHQRQTRGESEDFTTSLAQDAALQARARDSRKRARLGEGPIPTCDRSGARSDDRGEDEDLESTLAKNPYVQAFAAQRDLKAMPEIGRGSDASSIHGQLGGFRTASSKLPLDRRNPRHRSHRIGGESDDGADPSARVQDVSGTRAINSAVLGPARRPRFSAPRPTAPADAPPIANAQKNRDLPEIPNVEPRLVEMIMNDVLDHSPDVDWEDIAGLEFAKRCVMEAVVWPMKRPDIFVGLRGPPKGLLLFGPPGTGKTLIGRAIASKSGAKFFNISASSLMSKWVGEGEKMVRALFSVARVFQPSVVFIDEIDSLLTQRTDGDQESSRRVKTEFLVQMDGAGTSREDRVLVVGATNRPAEIDEAARRRLVKRLYIPLPDDAARASLVTRVLRGQRHELDAAASVRAVVGLTAGYSGSDMYALCAEAALGPVRDLGEAIGTVDAASVRAICLRDFETASRMVRASVSEADLQGYVEWNRTYGSFPSDMPEKAADSGADGN